MRAKNCQDPLRANFLACLKICQGTACQLCFRNLTSNHQSFESIEPRTFWFETQHSVNQATETGWSSSDRSEDQVTFWYSQLQEKSGKLSCAMKGPRKSDKIKWKIRCNAGLPGLAFSRPKNDKFGLFYIGWPGHSLYLLSIWPFLKSIEDSIVKSKHF